MIAACLGSACKNKRSPWMMVTHTSRPVEQEHTLAFPRTWLQYFESSLLLAVLIRENTAVPGYLRDQTSMEISFRHL